MTLSASELLERVADRLETRGWCQGTAGGEAGPNCVLGAMTQVLRLGSIDGDYRRELDRWKLRGEAVGALRDVTGALALDGWNDMPGRARQEVLDATRKAAKLARIREESA